MMGIFNFKNILYLCIRYIVGHNFSRTGGFRMPYSVVNFGNVTLGETKSNYKGNILRYTYCLISTYTYTL